MCFAKPTQLISRYTDDARYLLIRLCLRKTDQWIKLSDLKYQRELGAEGVLNALRVLCSKPPIRLVQEDIKPKIEEETIDLTALVDVNEEYTLEVEAETTPDYSFFARDESDASLEELLSCLRSDDLKDLVKQMRLKPRDNKVCIRKMLLYFSLTIATPSARNARLHSA